MPTVLDESQLRRIENVHGGFLYQHLYAVSLLLSWVQIGWKQIAVERDEDVEVILLAQRLYIQVKKRASTLTYGDVSGVLDRFVEIRREHQLNRRTGTPECWIVSNAEPGPDLTNRIKNAWPDGVHVLTPRARNGDRLHLPVPGAGLEQMWDICVRLANLVPHSTLKPETLVWKLAALVQHLATGTIQQEHLLTVEELRPLLEQLITQLQSLPEPLEDYRPQEREPAYRSDDPVRLITGFSGAGKTSWVAEMATHTADRLLYFDVADLPSAGVPPAVAREMAAFVLPQDSPERKKILLPGVSGIQSLRLIDKYVAEHVPGVSIVLDNAHRVATDVLVETARSMPNLKWIVLAQSWPGSELFISSTDAKLETLSGWSRDTIAQEATSTGCFGTIESFQLLHDLTGGLPLFARDASRLCREIYRGDLVSYLTDLSDHVTLQTTSQEVIVSQVLQRLSADARALASLLSIFTVPFHRDVVLDVTATALRLTRSEAARQLRILSSWGIIRFSAGGELSLHDSFRLLTAEHLVDVPETVIANAKEKLYQIVWTNRVGGGPERFRLLCRLTFETQRIENLVDILTNTAEVVTEFGLEDEMSELLNKAAEDTALSAEDRFWAEDTLTFWALQRNDLEEAKARFGNVQALVKGFTPSETIRIAVLTKELLIAGKANDLIQLRAVFQRAAVSSSNGMARRIVTYNYAHGLLTCGRPDLALPIATTLVNEYYELLGISSSDVFFHKLNETAAKIRDLDNNYDEIKRLADSLDLQGSAAHESGSIQPFAKLHAHKFFLLSSSFASAVRVGMDFVDECISDMGDAECARDFIENFLLLVVHEQKMIGALVPVSCQYAVVLAYCGRFDLASKTLQEMAPYIVEGTSQADEYLTQTALVGRIKTGEVRLPTPRRLLVPMISKMPARNVANVGRNDLCPCSSGLKFKKCCGR